MSQREQVPVAMDIDGLVEMVATQNALIGTANEFCQALGIELMTYRALLSKETQDRLVNLEKVYKIRLDAVNALVESHRI